MRTRATDAETVTYLLKKYHHISDAERNAIAAAVAEAGSDDEAALNIVVEWLNVDARELRDARWAASPAGQDYLINGPDDPELAAEWAEHNAARTARRHPDQLWYCHPVAVLPGEKLT